MRLGQKLLLFGLVPLAVVTGLLVVMVQREGRALTDREVAELERILLQTKKSELRNYVDLARGAIAEFEKRDDDFARALALDTLQRLDFGPDGYFFVNDLNGRNLMHPRQPDLVGKDLWSMTDEQGRPTIQQLVTQARAGGGFVDYSWQRPSQRRVSRKLGYVVPLPRWGWMMGSGIYLDDIDQVTSELRRRSSQVIQQTIWLVAGVAAVAALLVVGYGVALRVTRRRVATARALARELVAGQEAERDRISRELHDGVMQELVSVKFIFEAALARLPKDDTNRSSAAANTIEQGIVRLNEGLEEIHRISQNLRPLSRDANLKTLLERLVREPGVSAEVRVEVQAGDLSTDDETDMSLFRVAQEAIGNVDRHSGARLAVVRLEHGDAGATLTVADDGRGFDVAAMDHGPQNGAGLSNMRKRIEALGGRLVIRSGGGGTTVQAWVPRAVSRS